MSTYTPANISAGDIDEARRALRPTPPNTPPRPPAATAKPTARARLDLAKERSHRAASAARRRHAEYGRRKATDGTLKKEKRPLTPPHHAAPDLTAQFLRDLGHPTTVIINRRAADQRPLWVQDAPW